MAESIIKAGTIKIEIPSINIEANSTKTIDLGDYGLPLGSYYLTNAYIGNYLLPYLGNEGTTFVQSFNKNTRILSIRNNATAWTNYTLILLFQIIRSN